MEIQRPANFVRLGPGQNWPPGQFWPSAAGNGQFCPSRLGQNWPGGQFWPMPRRTKLTGSLSLLTFIEKNWNLRGGLCLSSIQWGVYVLNRVCVYIYYTRGGLYILYRVGGYIYTIWGGVYTKWGAIYVLYKWGVYVLYKVGVYILHRGGCIYFTGRGV